MGNNAIFFPYINVPDDAWFFRVLLYWDKVSSIAPYDHIDHPELLAPHMRKLLTAGLVEQIPPGSYTYKIPHFEDAFLNYVYRRKEEMNQEKVVGPSKKRFLIHIEKIGNIGEHLVDLEVAQLSRYPWYEVDEWVANDFMCYLASSLGKLKEIDASPVTNKMNNPLLAHGNPISVNENGTIRRQVRQSLLDILLPGPEELPDVDELLYFKQAHGKELSRFRNVIEATCIDLANIHDEEARDERTQLLLQSMQDDARAISDSMKSRWQKITFGALLPILGAGLTLPAAQSLQNPVSIVTEGLSLASVIYGAYKGVKEFKKVLDQPLAYVALTKARFKSKEPEKIHA